MVPEKFLMNIKDCGLVANVSINAIYKWGIDPVVSVPGRQQLYDVREIVKKRISNITGESDGAQLQQEKIRLTQAQADEAELKVAERRGDLVKIDIVEKVWSGMILNFTAKLDSFPSKYAPFFEGADTNPKRQAILKKIFDEARVELRDYEREEYTEIAAESGGEEGEDDAEKAVRVRSPQLVRKKAAKKKTISKKKRE